MWQELLNTLERILASYKLLDMVLKKKHGILIAVDMKGLEKILSQEQDLTGKISGLESERQQKLLELAKKEKRLTPGIKMKEMVSLCPAGLRPKFKQTYEDLDKVVDAVKRQNELNSILVHGALIAVNQRLGKIGGMAVEPAYGSRGQDQVSHRQNFEFKA